MSSRLQVAYTWSAEFRTPSCKQAFPFHEAVMSWQKPSRLKLGTIHTDWAVQRMNLCSCCLFGLVYIHKNLNCFHNTEPYLLLFFASYFHPFTLLIRESHRSVKLTTYLQLLPTSRISDSKNQLPILLSAVRKWLSTGQTLHSSVSTLQTSIFHNGVSLSLSLPLLLLLLLPFSYFFSSYNSSYTTCSSSWQCSVQHIFRHYFPIKLFNMAIQSETVFYIPEATRISSVCLCPPFILFFRIIFFSL
jgi:hypothetical protein